MTPTPALLLILLLAFASAQHYTEPEPDTAVAEEPAAEAVEEAVELAANDVVTDDVPEEVYSKEETVMEAMLQESLEDVQAEVNRVEQQPLVEQASEEETPEEEASEEQASEDKAPEEQAPKEEAPEEQAPEEQAPEEEAPEEEAPKEEAPEEEEMFQEETGAGPAAGATYPSASDPTSPSCSLNTTRRWCLKDPEYPADRIRQAVAYHHYSLLTLYQDLVADTDNSVERLTQLKEESYLCGSRTSYVQPLRAVNTDGEWRVIVNGIKVHYDKFTQTVRLEECTTAGESCPLVPACYDSTCLQQAAVQRLLVYDENDYYQPFAVETFKLPSSCACAMGAYEITH